MNEALHQTPQSEWRYRANPLLEKVDPSILQQRPAALAVARKVGYQFPITPEAALYRAVFQQSVVDLFLRSFRRGACLHLQGSIYEAEICGIDSEWIRYQFEQAGVSLDERIE